jgi:hypothetical protein
MTTLQDKIVLITGATAGIGRAAAKLFVSRGAAVVLGGRRQQEGEALAEELREAGGRAEFRVTDVTRHADNEALVALALSKWGRLDVAFDNAGIEATGSLAELDDATYDKVFDTNVRGVFSSIRAQIPSLTATRGAIILTSSTAGSRGFAGAAVYTASKHAGGHHESGGARARPPRHPRERGRAWTDGHRHARPLHGRAPGGAGSARSPGPRGHTGGGGGGSGVAGQRRSAVRQRRRHPGKRRAHRVIVTCLTVCTGYFARIVAENAQRNA